MKEYFQIVQVFGSVSYHSLITDEVMQINESKGMGNEVDEPNATTYAAIEAAEKGEDMTGPFDNIAVLMVDLEASEYPCETDGNT